MYATVLHKNYGDIAKELVRSHMFSSSLEAQYRPDMRRAISYTSRWGALRLPEVLRYKLNIGRIGYTSQGADQFEPIEEA